MSSLLLAIWSLWQRRGRVVLAALALAFGIASVILGLSIVSGYQKEIEKMTFGAYSRALIIRENKLVLDVYGPPNLADGKALKSSLEGLESIIYRRSSQIEVRHNRETYYTKAVGFFGDFSLETGDRLYWGKLADTNTKEAKRQCLLGYRLASNLKILRAEPKPKTIIVNDAICDLVGIMAEPESRIEEAYGLAVVMPFNFLVRYVDNSDDRGVDELDQITVIFKPDVNLADKTRKADKIMRKNHGIPQTHASGFTYNDENFPLKALEKQRNLVGMIILVLGGLSVLVSALGFGVIWVNMLAARKSEIATQIAVGANFSNLLLQLITEVCFIAVLAALIGFGLSYFVGQSLQAILGITIIIAPLQILWIVGLSVLLAIIIAMQAILSVALQPLSNLVK